MNFIEKIKLRRREENMYILRDEIDLPWVRTKISNHLERHPHLKLTSKEVRDRILKDDLIASFFIKDPGRQNVSEQAMIDVLKSIKIISNASSLPNSGPNSRYLIDGKVVKNSKIGIKSIDFQFTYKNYKAAATLKYTKESGGAQDNQFNDVVTFLQNSFTEDKNLLILAILDGEYYTPEKISTLKNINPSKNVIICSCLELEEILLNEY